MSQTDDPLFFPAGIVWRLLYRQVPPGLMHRYCSVEGATPKRRYMFLIRYQPLRWRSGSLHGIPPQRHLRADSRESRGVCSTYVMNLLGVKI